MITVLQTAASAFQEEWRIAMSTRLLYWFGAEDGVRSHFLSGPLDRFEAWFDEWAVECPDEFTADIAAAIKDARLRGAKALEAGDQISAARVDKMLSFYYGYFCDSRLEQSCLTEADGSALPIRYHQDATRLLERQNRRRTTLRLWRYLLSGRPVLRDAETLPFISDDGVWRLSYWTYAECMQLHRDLMLFLPQKPRKESEHAIAAALRALSAATANKLGLIVTVS
jgi:hypothetical protein